MKEKGQPSKSRRHPDRISKCELNEMLYLEKRRLKGLEKALLRHPSKRNEKIALASVKWIKNDNSPDKK